MATASTLYPTAFDLAKKKDPDGTAADIVEMLQQTNDIYHDIPFREANDGTAHRTTARTGIPEPAWKKYYGMTPASKTTTAQVTATCGMLDNYSEIDAKLVEAEESPDDFRLSEDAGIIQGFGTKVARYLFYGNEGTEPEAITGLGTIFGAKVGAENGDNIILADATASGNTQASIWLCCWGPQTGFGIVPRNSKAGWVAENLGKMTKEDSTGLNQVYRTHYMQDVGLVIRDWRYFVRIANIDIDNLTKTGATGSDLIDCLSQAVELPPSLNVGTCRFYANRKIRSFLRRQIANKVVNSTLSMESVGGKHVLVFDGIQFSRCDQLTNTEAVLV